jgi:hypothetical protein
MTDGARSRRLTPARVPTYRLTFRFPKLAQFSVPVDTQSIGSRGDCFANAVAESFFATLKKELVNRRPWPTIG